MIMFYSFILFITIVHIYIESITKNVMVLQLKNSHFLLTFMLFKDKQKVIFKNFNRK